MWTVPSCFSAERATVAPQTVAGIQAPTTRLCPDFRRVRRAHGAALRAAGCAAFAVRRRGYAVLPVAGNIAGLFIALPTLVPFLCQ